MFQYIYFPNNEEFVEWQQNNPNLSIVQLFPMVGGFTSEGFVEKAVAMSEGYKATSTVGICVVYQLRDQVDIGRLHFSKYPVYLKKLPLRVWFTDSLTTTRLLCNFGRTSDGIRVFNLNTGTLEYLDENVEVWEEITD